MRSVVLGELRHNARRSIGAALAVGIAVAFVVAVLGATQTMADYVTRSSAGAQLAAATVVTAPDGPMPQGAAATLKALPQVAAVYPQRIGFVKATYSDGAVATQVVSDPPPPLRWYTLLAGHAPAAHGDVLVDNATAASLHLQVGSRLPAQPIMLDAGSGAGSSAAPAAVTLTVSGIVTAIDLTGLGGRVVIAGDADVLAWGGADGQLITLAAAPGVDQRTLQQVAEAAVPAATVLTGTAAVEAATLQATRDVDVVGRLLGMFTVVALMVATLVISNTFAIVVAQRADQLALARCVGATRRQVFLAVLAEAVVVGTAASALGAVAGLGLLLAGVAVVTAWFPAAGGLHLAVTGASVALAVGAGALVTVGAALMPARRATRVAPLSALRPAPTEQVRRVGRLRAALGLAMLVGGGALLTAVVVLTPTSHDAQRQMSPVGLFAGMAAGALAVLGVMVAGQVIAPGVARLLGGPMSRLGPVGRLTAGNAVRNPARVSATSMALFVGVCLITVMSVGAATVTTSLNNEIDARFPVDLAIIGPAAKVPAPSPQSGTGATGGSASTEPPPDVVQGSAPIPAAAVAGVKALPDVVASAALRSAVVQVGPAVMTVYSADPVALQRVMRAPVTLHAGQLLLADGAPYRPEPSVASVVVTAGKVSVSLVPGSSRTSVSLVSPADFARLTAGGGAVTDAALLVRLRDGIDAGSAQSTVDAALAAAGAMSSLGSFGPGPDSGPTKVVLQVDGALPQRAAIEQVMNVLLWVATGLLGVSLAISLVGIGNTMALSVLERRREIGVLRALGLTRRQLRGSLTLEALLLAMVGSVLGLVLGIGFGYAGAKLLLAGVVPVGAPTLPVPRLALIVLAAGLAAVLASVLPGRRAGRISPTTALAAT
jgi:putative ABC transport system permease protein